MENEDGLKSFIAACDSIIAACEARIKLYESVRAELLAKLEQQNEATYPPMEISK